VQPALRLALQLLVGACASSGGVAWSQTQELEKRAAELRTQRDMARKGSLIEYELARSGLDSCRRALALADGELREAECHEAQRRIDACHHRRELWGQSLEHFALDSTAAGEAMRYATLLKSSLPECPSTLAGRRDGPVEALVEDSRRERRQIPGFSVCESYLRAMLVAADAKNATLVRSLAQELVSACGADHADYRRQAEAALVRMDLDPVAVLSVVRPVKAPASAASAP
jgi:hypothetical protein